MPESSNERENVSKHILPTAANLLGLCFILISFLKLWKLDGKVYLIIDKLVGLSIVLFLVSSLLSYMSMRARKKSAYYEKVADIFFLIGLFSMTAFSLMIAFEVL
ncbi:MAG: hypothetical protein HZA23_01610 [Nitrospirae bacterium]|nr:hypothetical protein [Nitrospirota bacterium]